MVEVSAEAASAPSPAAATPESASRSALRVLVLGVEGRIAREFVGLARDRYGIDSVTTVLRVPGKSPGPRSVSADAEEPAPAAPVPQARTVVCVALSTDLESDLRVSTGVRRRVLTELVRAAGQAASRHLIVVSSARVYGARADNPVPLPAHHPLRARDDGGVAGDLLAVEDEITAITAARPDLKVTIMRAAAVVGPGVDTSITRHFESPRLLVLGGSRPLWQFLHVEDLARAILAVVQAPLRPGSAEPGAGSEVGHGGIVTVGAPHPLTQERVERICGKRRLELPAAAAHATARRLHAAGVLSTSGGDLDYVRYPWVVGSEWLESMGWAAKYDNETCLQVLLEQLRDRGLQALRREAAVGTASAAVALVGTAAMLKRRRRKGA